MGQAWRQRVQEPQFFLEGKVGFEFEVRHNLAEEDPGAVAGGEDVGVLAEPAHAGSLGGCPVKHGPVVHVPAGVDVTAEPLGETPDVELEAFLHHLVVVVAPGVAGHTAFEGSGGAAGGEVVA